jgi:hypothetical protein
VIAGYRYDRTFIAAAHARFPQLPPLTARQAEALDVADALCSDPQVGPYNDEKVANRDTKVWHGATEKGS